jgi:hypothetical protein
MLAQNAEGETDIGNQRFQERDAALVADGFLNLFGAAHRKLGRSASFVGRHSALEILLDEHFEMRLQLFFELGVLSPLSEHAGES